DVAAGVEELRVLITVRVHLNRSATCPGAEEERQDDGLPLVIAEPDGIPEKPPAGGAGQLEVRRDGADFERRGYFLLLRLLRAQCGGGRERECEREQRHETSHTPHSARVDGDGQGTI